MRDKLDSWSEPFFASGATAGKGILKNLGTPPLEKLELFTREVIQNCWDAADPAREGLVTVRIACDEVEESAIREIRSRILSDARKEIGLGSAFQESPNLLRVSDRGTHGLAGPTRADLVVEGPTDFRDFVRNVGEPPDKKMGGGSFGFGKAALYLVSLAHCIVIHTRAKNEHGDLETRLMGAGLSVPFAAEQGGEQRRFTGRHAWGVPVEEAFVDPIRNEECEPFAEMLGLQSFGENETGTDIVIVAPDLSLGGHSEDGAQAEQAMNLIARSVAWHFWPKLYGPRPTMDITVELDGRSVPLPSPENDRKLEAFVSALFALEGETSTASPGRSEQGPVKVGVQQTHVGDLVIQTHLIPNQPSHETEIAAPDGDESLNHVALMRNAELVVRYVEGPELPVGQGGYAGVFRVKSDDVELDNIFRASEPPSHDDWIPQALEDKTERMYVNMAIKRVRERMEGFVAVETPAGTLGEDVPLGQFSRQLASLVPSVSGEGARSKSKKKGQNAPSVGRPIEVRKNLRPTVQDGEVFFESTVRALEPTSVTANPVVLSGSSAEKLAPEGAGVPDVLKWTSSSGREVNGATTQMDKGEEWTVLVSSPGDSVIRVDFEVGE